MNISESIQYIGVNDHEVDLFEGQYDVPLGMAYNSYVILDEKIAVMDSVDKHFGKEWLNQLKSVLKDRIPDYLIVQHMEPDHSANIDAFMQLYPNTKIVANAKAFPMMKQFFGKDYNSNRVNVTDGDTLCLGEHTLRFITAPMVHWPEVIMTYEEKEGILFSADAFGKFGANDVEDPEGWTCEARRYYFGIVGKYGLQVQTVLKKASALNIKTICPLHGPILTEDLGKYLSLYHTWSSYQVESEGIVIAYTSVYGNTKKAAEKLSDLLINKGCKKVVITDLAREDMYETVENAFRYGTLVLASTTYNGDVFPIMRTFIEALTERGYQKRKIAFIENGTWFPTAAKVMQEMFEKSKDITFAEHSVKILSAMNQESEEQLIALAEELTQ